MGTSEVERYMSQCKTPIQGGVFSIRKGSKLDLLLAKLQKTTNNLKFHSARIKEASQLSWNWNKALLEITLKQKIHGENIFFVWDL